MPEKKTSIWVKLAMAPMAVMALIGIARPMMNNNPGWAPSGASETIVFPDIEQGLSLFAAMCLTSASDFSARKSHLRTRGAGEVSMTRNGKLHEIYTIRNGGGVVTFTTGTNSETCGVTARGSYREAEAAGARQFLGGNNSERFSLFSQTGVKSSETKDAHLWSFPSEDGGALWQVQIRKAGAPGGEEMVAFSHSKIDLGR